MQEVKHYLRTIGDVRQGAALGVQSAADVETELVHEYLSKEWKLSSTHYIGAVRNDKGDEIGYRILHVLVREDYAPPVVEPKKK